MTRRRLTVLVVVLVLLLGLVVVADRVLERWAEGYVAEQLVEQAGLAGEPEVDARGFPFLTQAIAGRYEEVRISLTAAELGQPEGTRADVVLRGVHAPLSDVIAGAVTELPVERIEGTATLSYALLAAELGPGTELVPEGDGIRITRIIEVFAREVPLTAVGQVLLDGSELVIDVDEASAAGVDVPDFVLERAVDLLDLRYPVPALPFGLQLTSVTPAEDGVDIRVEATDTVLAAE